MTFKTKEDALDALEIARADWLNRAREFAANHAKKHGEVTIEDVREHGPILPDDIDPRVCGAVFRKGFELIGYRSGKRSISHRRPICVFKIKANT